MILDLLVLSALFFKHIFITTPSCVGIIDSFGFWTWQTRLSSFCYFTIKKWYYVIVVTLFPGTRFCNFTDKWKLGFGKISLIFLIIDMTQLQLIWFSLIVIQWYVFVCWMFTSNQKLGCRNQKMEDIWCMFTYNMVWLSMNVRKQACKYDCSDEPIENWVVRAATTHALFWW